MKAIEFLIISVALAKSALGGSGKCTYIRYLLCKMHFCAKDALPSS
jgi:hypothetical protein